MRDTLSRLVTEAARNDPKVILLTSDHGYSLFDQIRKECPNQFINCGIIEQAMIGIAAGLARIGFKPIVYGLASFVPMRCLEQIKLDICYSNLPVMILGDGAGLVYSSLGASHHCSEDLACLRPMPNLRVAQPADLTDLEIAFQHAGHGPLYLRIGRTDLGGVPIPSISNKRDWCFVGSGSMAKKANELAKRYVVSSVNMTWIKPIPDELIDFLIDFKNILVMEEHHQAGGVYSALAEEFGPMKIKPSIIPFCLKDAFADKCGSWQYALSEHEMDDASLERRVKEILNGT